MPIIKDIRINDAYGVEELNKCISGLKKSKLEFIFDRPVSVEYRGEPIGNFDPTFGERYTYFDLNEFRDMRIAHTALMKKMVLWLCDKLYFDHANMTEGGTVLSFNIRPNDYSVAYPEQQRFFIDDIADTSNNVGSQFKVVDLNGNETTLRELFINNPDLSHVMYDGDNAKPGIRKDDGVDGETYPTIFKSKSFSTSLLRTL